MVDFFKTGLKNIGGKLFIGNVSADKLAKEFGTPLYVINEQRIREKYKLLEKDLKNEYAKERIYYPMKANSNLNVLKILNSEGAYIDAVSVNEVFAAIQTGFAKEKILFTGTSVTNEELKILTENGIRINIDSISALERLGKISESDFPRFISARINPETGSGHHSHTITGGPNSKFGIWETDAIEFYKKAKELGTKEFGIHMHIGSGILNIDDFIAPVEKLLDIAGKISEGVGINFEFIDIGGGLGVPYSPDQNELDINEFANKILAIFKRKIIEYNLGEPYFCLEPGKFLVADAGVLLTRVNTLKQTPYKKFAGIDAGFNVLLRPTLYGSYHHIMVDGKLRNSYETKNMETYDVVGPICESGDCIAKERKLPKLEEGDLLAILTTGAYGYSMSSNYNLRTRAAEVLVNNRNYEIVREKDKLEKILSNQKKASWL